jgi:hypothetical protein
MSIPFYLLEILPSREGAPKNLHYLLNNFFERFLPKYRNNSVLVEHWNTEFKEIPCIKRCNGDDHSELKLSQTPREFFDTIDEVMGKSTQRHRIRQLIQDYERIAKECWDKERHRRISNIQQELNRELLPIYKILLRKGYNHIDLAR